MQNAGTVSFYCGCLNDSYLIKLVKNYHDFMVLTLQLFEYYLGW